MGSLLLPVSDLTNLLALHRRHLSSGEFLGAMWWQQVIALVVMMVVLVGWHRRGLSGTYDPTGRPRPRPVTGRGWECGRWSRGTVPRGSLADPGGRQRGALTTPCASLATLLWCHSCRERGLHVRWSPLLVVGAVIALVAVPLAALAV